MADKIQLKGVRLSFPALFFEAEFQGEKGKFEATFLIDKSDKKTKRILDTAIQAAIAEKNVKVAKDKIALKDGDDSDYDGYENCWSLKASSKRRPTVIDRDKSPITEADGTIYAGCYVNAIVDFWVQNNSFGKRVNCNLYGVQFVKDGEPFGTAPVDVSDDFDEIDVDEDLEDDDL